MFKKTISSVVAASLLVACSSGESDNSKRPLAGDTDKVLEQGALLGMVHNELTRAGSNHRDSISMECLGGSIDFSAVDLRAAINIDLRSELDADSDSLTYIGEPEEKNNYYDEQAVYRGLFEAAINGRSIGEISAEVTVNTSGPSSSSDIKITNEQLFSDVADSNAFTISLPIKNEGNVEFAVNVASFQNHYQNLLSFCGLKEQELLPNNIAPNPSDSRWVSYGFAKTVEPQGDLPAKDEHKMTAYLDCSIDEGELDAIELEVDNIDTSKLEAVTGDAPSLNEHYYYVPFRFNNGESIKVESYVGNDYTEIAQAGSLKDIVESNNFDITLPIQNYSDSVRYSFNVEGRRADFNKLSRYCEL